MIKLEIRAQKSLLTEHYNKGSFVNFLNNTPYIKEITPDKRSIISGAINKKCADKFSILIPNYVSYKCC